MPHDDNVLAVLEPSALVGRVAVHLARSGSAGLPDALALLVDGTGLRSAVLRSAGRGDLLAVAGEVVHAVPLRRAPDDRPAVAELPVRGPGGADLATLTVVGARPGLLPALRAVAAVVALTLAADLPVTDLAPALLTDAESDRDALADALHDGPVQDLVAARYAADIAARLGDASLVREAVQQALVALRRTMWHLRPRGENGLADALRALSERLAEAGRPALELRVPPEADALAAPAARAAYRLVQAVAGDTPAVVTLLREPACCVLEVVGGRSVPDPERWRRTAAALGGELTCRRGTLRLALPVRSVSPSKVVL